MSVEILPFKNKPGLIAWPPVADILAVNFTMIVEKLAEKAFSK